MSARPHVEEARRLEILDAALKSFAALGFHRTSMDKIAEAAGLSKALIYYYFADKEAVFEAGLDLLMDRVRDLFPKPSDGMSAAESLRRMAELNARSVELSQDFLRLMLEYWSIASRRPRLMENLREHLQGFRREITGLLEKGLRDGEFRSMDVPTTAAAIFAGYDGLWSHWLLDRGAFPLRETSILLMETFLADIEMG